MTIEMEIIIKCIMAAVLGGLIGLERSFHGRAAGIRTHSYVCLGSALSVIVALVVREALPSDVPGDVFRIPAQVVSGIGFLGVGTIFIKKDKVTGLTTAAGIWTTAIVGIAIGYGCYLAALVVSALMLILNVCMADMKTGRYYSCDFYLELEGPEFANSICDKIQEICKGEADIRLVKAKSSTNGYVGINATVYEEIDLAEMMRDTEHVVLAVRD